MYVAFNNTARPLPSQDWESKPRLSLLGLVLAAKPFACKFLIPVDSLVFIKIGNKCLESWIRGPQRTPREPENSVSHRGHDGARPPNYHQSQAGFVWLSGEHHACEKILHLV